MIGKSEEEGKRGPTVTTDHKERARWRRGLAAVPGIPVAAYKVGVVIEDMMNRQSGQCYASQAQLGRMAAMSARHVRTSVAALVKTGWLAALSGKDRARPRSCRGLHYQPQWPDEATRERCLRGEFAHLLNGDQSGTNVPDRSDGQSGTNVPHSSSNQSGTMRNDAVADAEQTCRSHISDGATNGDNPALSRVNSPTSLYVESCSEPSTRPLSADAERSEDTQPKTNSPSSMENKREAGANLEALECATKKVAADEVDQADYGAPAIENLIHDEPDLQLDPPDDLPSPPLLDADGPQPGDRLEIGPGAAVSIEIAFNQYDDDDEDDDADTPPVSAHQSAFGALLLTLQNLMQRLKAERPDAYERILQAAKQSEMEAAAEYGVKFAAIIRHDDEAQVIAALPYVLRTILSETGGSTATFGSVDGDDNAEPSHQAQATRR